MQLEGPAIQQKLRESQELLDDQESRQTRVTLVAKGEAAAGNRQVTADVYWVKFELPISRV